MNNEPPKYKPLKHLRWPFTPYKLFSPVTTVFEDAMTYEEQLLGLYKLYNQFITEYNKIIESLQELQELVDTLPDRMDAIELAMKVLQSNTAKRLAELANQIAQGDKNTLASANKYTDDEIAKLKGQITTGGSASFGITAGEYDSMNLTATDYDDMNITAREYDERGRIVFFGDVSTIYLQFKNTVTANTLENVFDLANPPVKLGRRYQFEISLGNFSLDGNEPAHLEIVGNNTLGNTLPITVPNGGSATVVGIFNTIPTAVRIMSGQEQITAYNAYIKIKPLGEA